eukprot:6718165-Pyramimonas_sp.AAC.1
MHCLAHVGLAATQEGQHLVSSECTRLGFSVFQSKDGKAAVMMNGQWKGPIRDIISAQSRLVVAVLGKNNHPIIFASVYLPDESVKDAETICDET